MTTTDTVLLIILTSLLSVFFVLCIAAVIIVIKLLNGVRRVANKAETVIDSVEAAADVFKDAGGRLAVLKLIKNIVTLAKHKNKKK